MTNKKENNQIQVSIKELERRMWELEQRAGRERQTWNLWVIVKTMGSRDNPERVFRVRRRLKRKP